jgi:hypothetical protein
MILECRIFTMVLAKIGQIFEKCAVKMSKKVRN